jgi:CubicO group peptidase (beta-lactamase class C family)
MRVSPFLLILLFPILLIAADQPRDLSSDLAPIAEQYKLPGLVGAIIHGDKLIALGSTGIRKIGDAAPFLPTDVIHLGSDTKAMTAILIAQLIDKKQIRFDSTMAEIFPNLAANMNPAMAKNTVRNLLDHNAGFPHDLPWGLIASTHLPLIAQRRMALVEALHDAPVTPIGSYSYSNVSFVVLGEIIETETGKSWEQMIQQQIFEPLHMDTAGFGPPGTAGKIDQPWGHILADDKLKAVHYDNLPVMAPAGEVHCSITDWSKFIAEILRSAQGHPTLVKADTFKELITPMPGQNYAGGWIVTQRAWARGLAMTHDGNNTTWCCDVWLAPKNNFAVLMATNFGGKGCEKALDDVAGVLIHINSDVTKEP